MATVTSGSGERVAGREDRRARRRRETIEEALDHAVAIMSEDGVAALTVSEVARRMGIQGPSLYKYFPSLHAVYDALFARGLAASQAVAEEAIAGLPPGVPRLRAGAEVFVRWAVDHPALAQLLHWRVVPGFEPSPGTFEPSVEEMAEVREDFAEAVRRGQLHPRADSDEAVRMLTVVLSGLVTQQMANQPGAGFDEGLFTSLTADALDMFFRHYEQEG